MNIDTANILNMETQLKEWSVRVKMLETRLESAGTDIKLIRAREINELRMQQCAAAEKLKQMKNTTNESWSQIKVEADKIWDNLKVGIDTAYAQSSEQKSIFSGLASGASAGN